MTKTDNATTTLESRLNSTQLNSTMVIIPVGNGASTTAMSKVFASAINKLRLISSSSPPPPLSSSSSALQIQQQRQRPSSSSCCRFFGTSTTTNGDDSKSEKQPNSNNKVYWNEEWKRLGLGATLVDDGDGSSTTQAGTERSKQKRRLPDNLFFVQLGFGVDQHGDTTNDATKACVRAVRNAIEFNSIPGVIQHVPGGRHGMLIHVKLGVPPPRLSAGGVKKEEDETIEREGLIPSYVDVAQVAKVFPYGRLLPIEVVVGGINFHSGRVVEELGDKDDVGICCVACVTIGYDNDDNNNDHNHNENNDNNDKTTHQTFNTKDGY